METMEWSKCLVKRYELYADLMRVIRAKSKLRLWIFIFYIANGEILERDIAIGFERVAGFRGAQKSLRYFT